MLKATFATPPTGNKKVQFNFDSQDVGPLIAVGSVYELTLDATMLANLASGLIKVLVGRRK